MVYVHVGKVSFSNDSDYGGFCKYERISYTRIEIHARNVALTSPNITMVVVIASYVLSFLKSDRDSNLALKDEQWGAHVYRKLTV